MLPVRVTYFVDSAFLSTFNGTQSAYTCVTYTDLSVLVSRIMLDVRHSSLLSIPHACARGKEIGSVIVVIVVLVH